jgi:hypothetical protein
VEVKNAASTGRTTAYTTVNIACSVIDAASADKIAAYTMVDAAYTVVYAACTVVDAS